MSIFYTTKDIKLHGKVIQPDGNFVGNEIRVLVQGNFKDVDFATIEIYASAKRGNALLISMTDMLEICAEIKEEYERLSVEEGYEDGEVECIEIGGGDKHE